MENMWADQKVPGLIFSTQYRWETVNIIESTSAIRELSIYVSLTFFWNV